MPNHFTEIIDNDPRQNLAVIWNDPLNQLDSAIGDFAVYSNYASLATWIASLTLAQNGVIATVQSDGSIAADATALTTDTSTAGDPDINVNDVSDLAVNELVHITTVNGTQITKITAITGASSPYTLTLLDVLEDDVDASANVNSYTATLTTNTGQADAFEAGAWVFYEHDDNGLRHGTVVSGSGTTLVISTSDSTGANKILAGTRVSQVGDQWWATKGNYDTVPARLQGIDRLPGAMRLGGTGGANNYNEAASTYVRLRTAPSGIADDLGYIVIDPFTSECELRKIKTISGRDVELYDALDYTHADDDEVFWQPIPYLTVEMFGAKGNNDSSAGVAAANATAFQRAMVQADSVVVASGATKACSVYAGPGNFYLSDSFIVPQQVCLIGSGRHVTALLPTDDFRRPITAISQTSSCTVTSIGHGLSAGDRIYINGVEGMVEINQRRPNTAAATVPKERGACYYVLSVPTADTFVISEDNATAVDSSSGYTAYSAGGHASKPMVYLGDPTITNTAVGTRLENLTILDNNHYLDIGVYSDRINETGGILWVSVYGPMYNAVRIDNTSQLADAGIALNYFIWECELVLNGRDAVAALPIKNSLGSGTANDDAAVLWIDGNLGIVRGLQGVTALSTPNGTPIRAGIELNYVRGIELNKIHTENCTDGILIGAVRYCRAIDITGYGGQNNTNLIHISTNVTGNSSSDITLSALTRQGTGTNIIVDDENGITLNDLVISLYICSGTAYISGGDLVINDGDVTLDNAGIIQFKDTGGTIRPVIRKNGDDTQIQTTASDLIKFIRGSTEMMRIPGSGSSSLLLYQGGVSAESRDAGNDTAAPALAAGRNTNASTEGPAAGTLHLVAADGTDYYLWVDATGDLRIHTAAPTGSSGSPTVSDLAGTVVGSQS